ncbi:hypothetical protein, partial [Paenibacillus sp. FSL H7-0331]|uniref:hypothetical protein n=1 Tax=Paenibacillus sp. FSL H7-0331 TaxID=1920421 RepID=UPI00097A9FBE
HYGTYRFTSQDIFIHGGGRQAMLVWDTLFPSPLNIFIKTMWLSFIMIALTQKDIDKNKSL